MPELVSHPDEVRLLSFRFGQGAAQHPDFGDALAQQQSHRGLILKFGHVETVDVPGAE